MNAKVAVAARLSLYLLLSTAVGCFGSATEVEATGAGGSSAAQDSSPLTGLYRAAPGHTLAISGSSRGRLTLTDFKTGMRRGLAAKGPDVYSIGPGLSVTVPALFRLTVQRDEGGRVESLLLEPTPPETDETGPAAPTLRALPCCPFHAEPYDFGSEGLRLAGTLYMPATRGPHPAVVWVHGSGPVTRWSAGSWPLFMVEQGFVVLAVDKRGVGASEGNYRLANGGRDNLPHMRRRALDVAAAVQSLAAHPDVDAERIGLIGASQAGWVIPMAAKLGGVAFTITISGGATPIDVEGRFSELAGENTDGGSDLTIDEIYQQLRQYRPRGFDFREEFAGMIGTFFEFPMPEAGDREGFHGATEIIDNKELYARASCSASTLTGRTFGRATNCWLSTPRMASTYSSTRTPRNICVCRGRRYRNEKFRNGGQREAAGKSGRL